MIPIKIPTGFPPSRAIQVKNKIPKKKVKNNQENLEEKVSIYGEQKWKLSC